LNYLFNINYLYVVERIQKCTLILAFSWALYHEKATIFTPFRYSNAQK